MNYTKKNFIIICIIILVLVVLIRFVYAISSHNANIVDDLIINSNIETFEDAIDLLNKLKSNDIVKNNLSSARITNEINITPWTTKLQNLKDINTIIPIGFYKPMLNINGKTYKKLGDMISLSTEFLPPSSTDAVLLINTSNSDIKDPIAYTLVKNIGVASSIPNIIQLQDIFTKNNMGIGSENIYTMLNNFVNYKANIQSYMSNIINASTITDTINNLIKSRIGVQNDNNIIQLNNITDTDNSVYETGVSITNNTIIYLPVGVDISIEASDGNKFAINWNNNIDLITVLLDKVEPIRYNSFTTNNFVDISYADKTTYKATFTIYPFTYIKNDIIDYLKNVCNNILIIYNSNSYDDGTEDSNNDVFIEYINLAKDKDTVNNVLIMLDTILERDTVADIANDNIMAGGSVGFKFNTPINATNAFASLTLYKDTTTFLGNLISLIVDNKLTYYYKFIKFTPSQLKFNNSNTVGNDNVAYNNTLVNKLVIKTTLTNSNINTILTSIQPTNFNTSNTSIMTINNALIKNTTLIAKITALKASISSGVLDIFPLYIYKPIAPPNYMVLGHLFCNSSKELNLIKLAKSVACVPIHCTREIRDWLITDKVFEYSRTNIYCAIYKNPYTGTFIAVDNIGFPEGKVCKVVACVAKCTAIDELTKADDCARKYQQLNKAMLNNTIRDLPNSEITEESIYLKKIKDQSNNIARLKSRAQNMQLMLDKSEIVNEEMNKSKLQNYVDTQQRNIELVAQKLDTDKNTIKTNINIPVNVINSIIDLINNMDTITKEQKGAIIDKIIYNATNLSNNIITEAEFKASINHILKACPGYDTSGLVRKKFVNDVCYGCDINLDNI